MSLHNMTRTREYDIITRQKDRQRDTECVGNDEDDVIYFCIFSPMKSRRNNIRLGMTNMREEFLENVTECE